MQKIGPSFCHNTCKNMYHLWCFQNKFWESFTEFYCIYSNNLLCYSTLFYTHVWYYCHCQWFTFNKMFWFYWIYKFFFAFLPIIYFLIFFPFLKKVLFFSLLEQNWIPFTNHTLYYVWYNYVMRILTYEHWHTNVSVIFSYVWKLYITVIKILQTIPSPISLVLMWGFGFKCYRVSLLFFLGHLGAYLRQSQCVVH